MERLRDATLELLARRRELLSAGAQHVGWKLGVGERESIDGSIAVGYLTSATTLEPGATYAMGRRAVDLRADVEIAVELSEEGLPSSYAVALELVDLAPVLGTPEAVIAANVFHRAVAFGPFLAALPPKAQGAAIVNGQRRGIEAEAHGDLPERLRAAANVLEAAGQELRPGDRVITGSIVQVAVSAGDVVRAEVDGLGSVELALAD